MRTALKAEKPRYTCFDPTLLGFAARRARSVTPGTPARNVVGWGGHILGETMAHSTDVIQRDPEILGGTPVFRGTRVPIQTLFDHLEAGDSLDTFLDDFPSVAREVAVAVLELAREGLLGRARAA